MSPRSEEDIRKIAQDVLFDTGNTGVYPVPILNVIEQNNFRVSGVYSDDAPKGFSGCVDYDTKEVTINLDHSKVRGRFTLAHELGHIILHPGENKFDYRFELSSPDPKETEANRFAGEILMPYAKFKEIYKKYNGDMDLISYFFYVSVGAANVRAQCLGLEI
jgi:Zn-dependent peptidase ImmA (M78 family)